VPNGEEVDERTNTYCSVCCHGQVLAQKERDREWERRRTPLQTKELGKVEVKGNEW
jgi:hypothetical protein